MREYSFNSFICVLHFERESMSTYSKLNNRFYVPFSRDENLINLYNVKNTKGVSFSVYFTNLIHMIYDT